MAVTCHILVSKDLRGIASTPVTNDMLKMYGIREEQLFDNALESSPKVNSPEIVNMDELLAGMYCEQYEMMGYNEDEIGEKLGGNFFVLPSSLHETIVIPNDGNMEYKAMLWKYCF